MPRMKEDIVAQFLEEPHVGVIALSQLVSGLQRFGGNHQLAQAWCGHLVLPRRSRSCRWQPLSPLLPHLPRRHTYAAPRNRFPRGRDSSTVRRS